jgi:hypothetical protein
MVRVKGTAVHSIWGLCDSVTRTEAQVGVVVPKSYAPDFVGCSVCPGRSLVVVHIQTRMSHSGSRLIRGIFYFCTTWGDVPIFR